MPVPGRPLLPLPGLRLVALLLAAGLLPLAAGPWAWWLVVAADLLVAALAFLDLWRAPRAERLELARRSEPVFALGEPASVTLTARNRSDVPVALSVLDALPAALREPAPSGGKSSGRPPLALLLPPYGEGTVQYTVVPAARGAYTLGPACGRYDSPWRLWRLRCRWPAEQPVRVYPHVPRQGGWRAEQRLLREEGRQRRRERAVSAEFESLREYRPDDDPRTINWAASARWGRLVVNQYRAEQVQPVLIAVDTGRLMVPEAGGRPKLDLALGAALRLAGAVVAMNDLAGLLLFSGQVHTYVPPGRGRAQVRRLAEACYAARPDLVEPDYEAAVTFLRARCRRRSLVCLFTDLVDPDVSRDLVAQVLRLLPTHLPLVIAPTDPDLLSLARSLPGTAGEAYRKAVAQDALVRRRAARMALERGGVPVVDAPPDQLGAAAVSRYLQIKASRRL